MDTTPVVENHPAPRQPRRRPPTAGLAALALFTSLNACTLEPSSPLPQGAELIVAPPTYQTWWAKTEGCSQLEGNLNRISWYVVPGVRTFQSAIGEVVGFWSRTNAGSRIILAGEFASSELVVRHEMLHELLGQPGHPPEYFGERCHLTWATWTDSTGTPAVGEGGI